MTTVEAVRELALSLPRTTEHLVQDRIKLRVGRLVYVAFSRDERFMGFAYPKDERDALVASDPATYLLPRPSDLRYQWAAARVAALSDEAMRRHVTEAWSMVVPAFLVRETL